MSVRNLSLVAAVGGIDAARCVRGGRTWKQPKTPWGDPDLQGTWPISHLMSVPLERPPTYGNRLEFTPEELAQQRKAIETQNQGYHKEEEQKKLGMGHWVEETGIPMQTSLIVDPPNGRLPAQTAVGKEMSVEDGQRLESRGLRQRRRLRHVESLHHARAAGTACSRTRTTTASRSCSRRATW